MNYSASNFVGGHPRSRASLTTIPGGVAVQTPYDAAFTAALKLSVPASDRSWDKDSRRWIVSPAYGRTVADLIESYLGIVVTVPATPSAALVETRMLNLRYLGRCKTRDDGSSTAYGFVDGAWSVVFAEDVLRAWFEGVPDDLSGAKTAETATGRPTASNTLYAALGARQGISDEDLRSAYRRMARQWHPDVCREADAAEQFKAIQHAYEVLRDPERRQRYDAGLALEAMAATQQMAPAPKRPLTLPGDYRSPLRCGWVLVDGTQRLARFNVSVIHAWEDIVNKFGQTLVVSWPAGADSAVEKWV